MLLQAGRLKAACAHRHPAGELAEALLQLVEADGGSLSADVSWQTVQSKLAELQAALTSGDSDEQTHATTGRAPVAAAGWHCRACRC